MSRRLHLPNSKKLRMAHGWEFKGSHGKPGTVDCPGEDGLTGGELTGHLIGRQVWVPTGQAADASPPDSHGLDNADV